MKCAVFSTKAGGHMHNQWKEEEKKRDLGVCPLHHVGVRKMYEEMKEGNIEQ